MRVELDLDRLVEELLAEGDFRSTFREGGRSFEATEAGIRAAIGKICAPFQAILEDAEAARGVLNSCGYGDSCTPLSVLVTELVDRLADTAGPPDPELPDPPEGHCYVLTQQSNFHAMPSDVQVLTPAVAAGKPVWWPPIPTPE